MTAENRDSPMRSAYVNVTDLTLFCTNYARKWLFLPAEGSRQKRVILPANLILATPGMHP